MLGASRRSPSPGSGSIRDRAHPPVIVPKKVPGSRLRGAGVESRLGAGVVSQINKKTVIY